MSDILKSYEDTIIGYLRNSCKTDLLLHIVHGCIVCAINEYNISLPMVINFSAIMYLYYSCPGFFTIKHNK